MIEKEWLVVPIVFGAWFAYAWLQSWHYNDGRWNFTTTHDGFSRVILRRRTTPTDPDFIDFGREKGKRIIRWGRFVKDRFNDDEIAEEKVTIEVSWFLFYPDLETLRRLVFYPWVEEKIALWEFDISTRWMLWHGHWLYDSPDGMNCGEAFYHTFPELIEEIRPKLKEIASRKKLPKGWNKY